MKTKIFFVFERNPAMRLGYIHLLFHRRGIFQGDGSSFKTPLCPSDDINWDLPLFSRFNDYLPSILMRFIMFPSILASNCPGNYLLMATTAYHDIRDSIVIVHKTVAWSAEALYQLKNNGNILLYDILDYEDPELECKLEVLDGLILCSHRAMDEYRATPWVNKPVHFIAHCTNPRIKERKGHLPHFSPLQNGAPENVLLYPSLLNTLPSVFCYTDCTPMEIWLQATQNANFFYAVRPPVSRMRAKPFTKGFTASKLNANILIHKDDGDALFYLGEDYPYLIKEEISEEVVLRYMRKAQNDFDGPEWHRGLEIMASFRDAFSDATLSRQFFEMIAHYA